MLVYVLKKKENMQHMTSGTPDDLMTDVTPPGPHHHTEAGLEPGFLARVAGALTRNAKGYSL